MWQISNHWSKNQKKKKNIITHGIFGWQSKPFRGNFARSEQKREVFRILHTVPWNIRVSLGSYHIKISILSNTYKWNRFYFCPRSKPHLQNCLIGLKDFLTQTAQGRRHTESKNKIVNIADTFFDLAADSLFLGHTVYFNANGKHTYLVHQRKRALKNTNKYQTGFT